MLANRVRETSTSIGVGNFILNGAAINFRPFGAVFSVINAQRFTYFIVDSINNAWETGRGYLLDATTLVRETVYENSAGTRTQINFGAGSKDVYCSPSHSDISVSTGRVPTDTVLVSELFSGATATFNGVADLITYTLFRYNAANQIKAFVVPFSSPNAGTKFRIGLYTKKGNLPDQLIISSPDMIQVDATVVEYLFAAIDLLPGDYFIAHLSNGIDNLRGTNTNEILQSVMGVDLQGTTAAGTRINAYETVAPGWTELPQTASAAITGNSDAKALRIGVRAA